MSIIKSLSQIKRYRQIIMVFTKHGFSTVIDRLGIFEYLNIRKKFSKRSDTYEKKLTVGERLKDALQELGPTFIKIGQLLSSRSDIIPLSIVSELEKLQDQAIEVPYKEIRQTIESEFGEKLENIFSEFNEVPIATGSIAQVHVAEIRDIGPVVVKVQRPGIERSIYADLKILEDLAIFINNHTKYGKLYDFRKMVSEFETLITNELDFRAEGENAEKINQYFVRDRGVRVPEIMWSHTSMRVLTMEFIQGISVKDLEALKAANLDATIIARRLATSIVNQILRDGFFHGDPHPGNIKIQDDGTIVFLDLGMVGKLSEERRAQFLKILGGVVFKNNRLITNALCELGSVSGRSNMKGLGEEIDIFREQFLNKPVSKINVGEAFHEIFKIAFSYDIVIPSEFVLLAKTIVTIFLVAADLAIA